MRPYLVHHLLEDSAARHPDREALRQGRRSVTFAELAAEAGRLAAYLLQVGLRREQRVGILLNRSVEQVASIFAASMAGGAFVVINPVLKPAQVEHIIADCDVRVLLTTRSLHARHDLTRPERVLYLDGGGEGPAADAGADLWPRIRAAFPTAVPAPRPIITDDLGSIIYTSGSTGMPKGVVLPHRNVVEGAEIVSTYLEITERDRLISVLPLNFDYGLNQLTSAMLHACTLVLHRYFSPPELLRVLVDERITGFAGLRPIWLSMFSSRLQLRPNPAAFPHLRYLTNTGGKIPEHVVRRMMAFFPNTRIYLMYGLTEAFRSTYLPPDEVARRPTSMGRAIPNVEILVVDADGNEVGPGEEGELVHRGALISRGYWNDPEKTARVFRRSPRLDGQSHLNEVAVFSGDVVRRDEEGFLYYVSRRDELIKAGGYRISPTEVEEALLRVSGASYAVVFGREVDDARDTIIVAVLETGGEPMDPEEIRRRCRKELPPFMVPSEIHFAERFETTASGKVDRSGIKRAYLEASVARDEQGPAAGAGSAPDTADAAG